MSDKAFVPQLVKGDLGRYFAQGFDDLYARGNALQGEVLGEIIGLVSQSAYAHDHGFAGISSKEEFRAKVPLSEYVDCVPYIKANMQNDAGQLTSVPTEYYLMSTGRGQHAGKYYSETHVGAVARQLTIDIYQMGIAKNEPILREPGFKTMPVVNSTSIPAAPNGKPVRRTSSQAGKALWENGGEVFVFPYEFLEAQMSEPDRNYMYALYALKEKGLVQTNCNNLAAFGDFLDCIEAQGAQMIKDIRTGHLSVQLQPHDREVLEGLFVPDEARANELQQLLNETGRLDPQVIWPRFNLATGWIGGSVGDYSRDVMARLPQRMRYYNTPYGCTETMIAATSNPGSDAGPLAVYACYFEFLPLEAVEAARRDVAQQGAQGAGAADASEQSVAAATALRPLEMHEVQVGQCYELLVTTYSGLCRYNLHDIVRVTGFEGETACVEFCGRASEGFTVGGSHLYGFQFSDVFKAVCTPDDGIMSLYQGFIEEDTACETDAGEAAANGAAANNPKLSLLIEFYEDAADMADLAKRLRAAFAEKDMPVGNIYVVKQGYRKSLYHALMHLGLIVQSMKLPVAAQGAPDAASVRTVL